MKNCYRNSVAGLVYILVSGLLVFISLEMFSRAVRPVFPGVTRVASTSSGGVRNVPTFNEPSTTYSQVSGEFNALTTIDSRGNRIVPSSDDKSKVSLVFLGDSFTFGQGLIDEETIPNIVCNKIRAKCTNLGVPGTSPKSQKSILKNYLKTSPEQSGVLIHLTLASTSQNHAGNDISPYPKSRDEDSDIGLQHSKQFALRTLRARLISSVRLLSKHSNLFRLLRLYCGDKIRILAFSRSSGSVSKYQLSLFSKDMIEMRKIASENGLAYMPVLVSSSSSVSSEDHLKTSSDLNELLPFEILLPEVNWNVAQHWYKLDGHFSPAGANVLALHLIDRLNQRFNLKQ